MSLFTVIEIEKLIGRGIDSLNYSERSALAHKWVALEIYTPKTLPMRRIEAVGDSPAACAQRLASRGLDLAKFEFSQVTPPFA